MSRLRLPYNGDSVPSGYQSCLSDHQLALLDKLLAACGEYEEEHGDVRRHEDNTTKDRSIRDKRFQRNSSKDTRRPHNATIPLMKFRSNLPSYKKRNEILRLITENQVVIIAGRMLSHEE